jgi:hypothetical protein
MRAQGTGGDTRPILDPFHSFVSASGPSKAETTMRYTPKTTDERLDATDGGSYCSAEIVDSRVKGEGAAVRRCGRGNASSSKSRKALRPRAPAVRLCISAGASISSCPSLVRIAVTKITVRQSLAILGKAKAARGGKA